MMRGMALAMLTIALAGAQPQTTPAADAAISGVVKDFGTGQPLANYNVSTYVNVTWLGDTLLMGQGKQVKSVTDDEGRYRISGLPPGPYRLQATDAKGFGNNVERRVTLSGQDLDHIDFRVKVTGSISGKILDENKEPVPGITVYLVSREYYSGVLGYFYKSQSVTNDRGEYALQRVQAGHPYLLMAEKTVRRMPAYSEAPLDPRLRRRAPMRTYYPNSTTREGGTFVSIRPGEHHEGIDIEMKRTQNYCITGMVDGPGGPAGLNFGIEGTQPAYGQSSTGGMFGGAPGGTTGPDGKFRICDLNPGAYRLLAFDRYEGFGPNSPKVNYALANVSILDEDLSGIGLTISPGMDLPGEVILDGTPSDPPASVNVSIVPLLRAGLPGERPSARSDIPGTFTLTGLIASDYGGFRPLIRAPHYYLKDARYSTDNVMYGPLHLGGAMAGAMLRITVGTDGATFNAQVSNKDGTPVSAIQVLAFPADASSEAMLQASLNTGQTNQLGQYLSRTLAPGKYYIGAIDDSFDATPESIGRLWRARNRFQEVILPPNGSAQIQLEPIKIE